METKKEITQTEKETVIARLRAIPGNALISIGKPFSTLSKDDMIKAVEEDTELGREIIEMQMAYLRSFRKG